MSPTGPTPEPAIADAVKGNWVDTYAPAPSRPYLRLSRADRPIGTWLLLLPCWWGLLLAMIADGQPHWFDLWIFVGCGIGAFLMRGAGCTWNDITDRHIDGKVRRTALRPIPSGQVTVRQAFGWMVAQALLGLVILLSFNRAAILLGVLSLVPVAVYPFAKRFTWWPQFFLGIAFNWGALLAWAAHSGSLGLAPILLYAAGIVWTLFYDTIYAHQDTEDDALIGVKSTARLFGNDSEAWLQRFLWGSTGLLTLAVLRAALPHGILTTLTALAGVVAFALHLRGQLHRFDPDDSDGLITLFRSNRTAGMLLVLFLAGALLV